MMKKKPFTLLFLALVFVMYGCAQSAPSRFYTLRPMSQPTKVEFQQAISVGPVLIPPVVDRPQMVTRLSPSRIDIDEFNRWAVPLQKEIARIIAENLANLLGSPRVTVFPQSAPDASAIRVSIDFLKFEAAADQSVTLDAQWTVRPPGDAKTATGRKTLKEPWAGVGYDDRITAYNHALERISEDIARSLLAL